MIDARRLGQMLLGEWEKTKQPLKERGIPGQEFNSNGGLSAYLSPYAIADVLAPIGTYEDGRIGLAQPKALTDLPRFSDFISAIPSAAYNMIAEPFKRGYEAANTPIPPINDDQGWADKSAAMFDVTSLAPIGGMLGVADNAVGVFGGRLAKTADHAALARAEKMAAEGAPREAIWNDTGWFQGVDGQWRFEIDDSGVPMKQSLHEDALWKYPNMNEVLGHKELFQAYPEVSTFKVVPEFGSDGAFYSSHGTVGLKPLEPGNFTPEASRKAKSTILHELQHAIQNSEGFAQGGNPATFTRGYQSIVRDANDQIKAINEQLGRAVGTPRYDELLGMRSELRKRVQEIEGPYGIGARERGFDEYKRLAGETESRTTQKRQPLTADERRARPPWLDYDVPEADQIVRFSANAPTGALPGVAAQTQDGQNPALLEYLKAIGLY